MTQGFYNNFRVCYSLPRLYFKLSLLLSLSILANYCYSQEITKSRPVATYSIVARDSITGEMGVAVQSHWFSVGSIVTWAKAGIGAIATQSIADPNYGYLGIKLMEAGKTAEETLNSLLFSDNSKDLRQVAMVDNKGNIGVHTGKKAIIEAGHHVGKQYSVQANLMEKNTVWDAMAKGYENAKGDLASRLLAALEAAQNEGGDIRGKQSAAILIVGPKNTGKPWLDRHFDLRVEDHPDPINELKRLVNMQRGYIYLNKGDEMVEKGNTTQAMEFYKKSLEILPDEANNGESAFWVGTALANSNKIDDAIPYFKRAYQQNKKWETLIDRLPSSGLLPNDPKLIKLIKKKMKSK